MLLVAQQGSQTAMQQGVICLYRNNEIVTAMDRNAVISVVEECVIYQVGANERG